MIKNKKEILIVILVFLFMGCGSVQIKSEDGSFRNDLRAEYYEKHSYKELYSATPYRLENVFVNVIIDEALRLGVIATYQYSSAGCSYYEKLNKYGMSPGLDEDTLWVMFRQMYKLDDRMGIDITLRETIQTKGNVQGTYIEYYTYQEVSLNEKGEFIIRQNVPKREAKEKEAKWINRFK